MWMYDAEQTRYAKRVVRGQTWTPAWVRANVATGSGPAGRGGDVLPAAATVPVAGDATQRGTPAARRIRAYRMRLHFARPMHRG